jgi:hypothetical protein
MEVPTRFAANINLNCHYLCQKNCEKFENWGISVQNANGVSAGGVPKGSEFGVAENNP